MTTYSALKFDKGMTPKVFTPNSATRIEHFDTITEVLRPFRTLQASTNNTGQATTVLGLNKFALLNDSLYASGIDASDVTFGAIYKWNTTNFDWRDKLTSGATSSFNAMLLGHAGFLIGLRNSRYFYKMTTAGVYTASFFDTGAAFTNGFADPIIHSKDGIAYFPIDNKIYTSSSAGAAPALSLTLPNGNYLITSISEQGNYINIVGYDVKSGMSSSLVWDRDTSVVDFTESISLGAEKAVHNATLLNNTFFVQIRENQTNSPFAEQPVLVIKYLSGNIAETLYEFPVTTMEFAKMGGKWASNDRLYFAASVRFIGESAVRNIVFCLDYKGRLTVAQNASIDTGTNKVTALLNQGGAFWLGAGSDGAWDTTTTYTTVASYETNDIRSDNLFMNIDFESAVITCEPLPASGQIVLKARKNEETTFTTIGTYTGTSKTKFKVNANKAKNALKGLDKAKQVRFRLESTAGAEITGFQALFKDVTDLDA